MASRGSLAGSHRCPHCKFSTSSAQSLGRHLNCQHRPWKFACRRCGERFPQRGRRKQHELLAHGIQPDAGDVAGPAGAAAAEAEEPLGTGDGRPDLPAGGKPAAGPRAVPIPLDLQCRECGRQLHSGMGFRSHMCRTHPAKWAKMRRSAINRWRQFGARKRGVAKKKLTKNAGADNCETRNVDDNENDDDDDEADETGADSNADQTPATTPASLNSSSASGSVDSATPKKPARVCPVCQKLVAYLYYPRHLRKFHQEAWLASGGRPRSAPVKAPMKQEPEDSAADKQQQLIDETSDSAKKSKLLVKITKLQSLPQVQSAQQLHQQASSSSGDSESVGGDYSALCGHCSKLLSCRNSLFRHIRSVHRLKHICMRCRRGFSRLELVQSHIARSHRLLPQSEIDLLLRYAGCKLTTQSATSTPTARFDVSPPSTPIDLEADMEIDDCLRPSTLFGSMPPPPPPPPPASQLPSSSRLSTYVQPAAVRSVVSCDLDASIVSEENSSAAADAVVSERHPCDSCHLSFVSAEFLASHRPLCESYAFKDYRVVSAWSVADTTAAEAAASEPKRTACPFCAAAVVPARLQRHIRDSAAAEAAVGSRLHTRPRVLMCGACYEAFPGSELLQNHQVLTHLNPAGRSLLARRCPECRLWLVGDAAMAEHEAAAHSEPTAFGCQVCRTYCPNRVALVTHYRWVHLLDGGDGDGLDDEWL